MMEKFRNLSHNIFFKIFLGFLGLAFVIFSISGFLLGSGGSWIAKVNGKTISYNQFIKIAQNDKESIYRSNPQPEVLKYLDSDQFKNDVLGRIITKALIKALQEELGIYADTDSILKQISEDPNFRDKNGKFSRDIFRNLLRKNNLTEEQYIDSIKDEIVGTIIVHALIEAAPSNGILAKALYKHREEKRLVDVVTISMKNIGNIKGPNDFELNGFFEKNKAKFTLPEMRKVSYLVLNKKDLLGTVTVSDEEINNEYKNNSSLYKNPETRDFYHLLFDDKNKAEEFVKSLESKSKKDGDAAETFVKLASETQKKDRKSILITKVTQKELFKEIASDAFALQKNQYSKPLKSPLGYHVFYVVGINPASQVALLEVKNKIKSELFAKKEEETLRTKLSSVNDEILATNSLEKVAAKFGFKLGKDLPKFNDKGLDSKSTPVEEIIALDQFVKNSFSAKKEEASKLFSSGKDKYYSIFVKSIDEGRQRSLDEVKVLATDLWIKEKKQQELQKLAENIAAQIKQNKGNVAAIAKNHNLKIEKNREFPIAYMVDVGGGKKVPYSNKFLEEIFSLKIGDVASPYRTSNDEIVVGILQDIKSPNLDPRKVDLLKQGLSSDFKNDVLIEYNKYIQKKFPVQINQKLLENKD